MLNDLINRFWAFRFFILFIFKDLQDRQFFRNLTILLVLENSNQETNIAINFVFINTLQIKKLVHHYELNKKTKMA